MDVLEAVSPLNEFLCAMHGPTENVARTMCALVPFPDEIASLPDAEILDLGVAVDATQNWSGGALVQAGARYATGARVGQIVDFYLDEFSAANLVATSLTGPIRDTRTAFQTTLADQSTLRVSIDNTHGFRSVRVTVRYGGFDHRELFARFAMWHNGVAPISEGSEPTGLEIATFAKGRRPSNLALYTTHYACDSTSRVAARAMVDDRLRELGYTYCEPRDGVMFIKGGQHEAEAHVDGDESSSNVSYVGEFQLS